MCQEKDIYKAIYSMPRSFNFTMIEKELKTVEGRYVKETDEELVKKVIDDLRKNRVILKNDDKLTFIY